MSGGEQERDLASQIHAWATQEMHFHPQGPFLGTAVPTVDQLRSMCRGTHQADLWNYVINNVRSVQTVRKVKGNLQLKARSQRQGYRVKYKSDGRYDDEWHNLLTQRAQLLGEVTTVLSETQQLEQELERMEADIQSAELEYQQEMECVRDMGRKTCLLQTYAHTADNFNASLDAFADRVQARTDALVNRRKRVDTALHHREEEDDTGTRSALLETATSKEVCVSCDHIGKFLHQTLHGSFSKDRNAFHMNKEQLWKQVETTLSDHNIEQIVNSLVQQSQQEALILREHTLKISIQKDAEKLRFKYEKGGVLTDTATQPSVLHSVKQLLEKNQLQHVMRFVETEKHRNTARPLLQRLQATRQNIDSLLKKKFASRPGNVQMGSMLVQCQLELVADRTARDGYRQEVETLRERVATEQATRDTLITLHRRIQDFQDLANAKQSLIQVVAKQNAGAKSRLTAQQLDVSDYISRAMPAHPVEMQMLTEGLRGAVVEEVSKVIALSLPYLLNLYLDSETKRGLLDLSINFTSHPTAISVRQPLHSALRHLHFPPYKAAECVLKHCLGMKLDVEREREVRQALDKHCSSVIVASGIHTDLDNVMELCERVKGRDREELDKFLPVIQKRLTKAASASTKCIKIKDLVQAWWEQPAQFTTPWVKSEELTYRQWYNKWRIVVTKIRQLDLHN